MKLTDINTVDMIGICKFSGHVILTLIDEMDWEDERKHLEILQEKINTYLRFVESGEILDAYPQAQARHAVIKVIGRRPLVGSAEAFFEQAASIIENAGLDLTFEVLDE